MYALTLDGSDKVVNLPAQESVLDACLAQGLELPYNCRSGECGECLAQLQSGTVRQLPGSDPAVFTEAMRAQGMVLTCMCFATSDLVLKVPLRQHSGPAIRQFDAVIESLVWHGPRTAQVRLRCPAPVEFEAGQYFEWHVQGVAHARSYSVAVAPGSDRLEFMVRIYPGGQISAMLKRHELAPGDVVGLRGPFGTYRYDAAHPGLAVFVAGGTGIGPVLSLVQSALRSQEQRRLLVLYGARDTAEMASANALQQWATRDARLKFVPVLSDDPTDSAWQGLRGTAVDALQAQRADFFGATAYLCGPPPMVEAAKKILLVKGVDAADVYYDRFAPAASGAAS